MTFRTLADIGPGQIIGSNAAFCRNDAVPLTSFGGAYQVDDPVPGGYGCRAPNPYTGLCTCPAGFVADGLRVEVDTSQGFIGSAIVTCNK
jgi:hypothetical protein